MNNVKNPIDNKKCFSALKECEKAFSKYNRESLDALEIGLQRCKIQLDKFNENNNYIDALQICLDTIKELHADARDSLCEKESKDLDNGITAFYTYCELADVSECIH